MLNRWFRTPGIHLTKTSLCKISEIPTIVQSKERSIALFHPHHGHLQPICSVGATLEVGQAVAVSSDGQWTLCSIVAGTVRALRISAYHGVNEPVRTLHIKQSPMHAQQTLPVITSAELTRDRCQQRLVEASIYGMGGAEFPSVQKHKADHFHTLIINAVECEPPISCDQALIMYAVDDIVLGIQLLAQCYAFKRIVIACAPQHGPSNAILRQATQDQRYPITIIDVGTHYPSGDIRQVIYQVTGKALAKGMHASERGLLCHNIATVYAIARSLAYGECLAQRVITLVNTITQHTQNYFIPLGITFRQLMDAMQIAIDDNTVIKTGGNLMPRIVADLNAPITAACQCIQIERAQATTVSNPCIRCGYCHDVCPVHLLPQQLYWYAQAEQHANCESYHLHDCIDCGACDRVCPSEIPILYYIRQAKQALARQYDERQTQQDAMNRAQSRQIRRAEQAQDEQKERQNYLKDKKKVLSATLARARARAQQKEPHEETTHN